MGETSVAPIFLVVDHNRDTRFLLVKSLSRKFPGAVVLEADDGETAMRHAGRSDLAAIVTHRTSEFYGTELVEKFRSLNDTVPIVMVSGIERTKPALAAGADRFMLYDEWLRIGSLVQDLLRQGRAEKVVIVDVAPGEPR